MNGTRSPPSADACCTLAVWSDGEGEVEVEVEVERWRRSRRRSEYLCK